jgi:linoleoyl-CoA desaturase
LAVLLGLSTTAIGFNIQHDGGHGAYSERTWVNRLTAWAIDLIGGSSLRWHWKHTIIHHMFVNITGYDTDIDVGPLARVSPHQKRCWFHRWQHLYMWPLYGLVAVKMQLFDDFRYLATGRLGPHHVPRPTGWNLAVFAVGKTIFLAWAIAIPLLLHPVLTVVFFYTVASLALGIVMALVFIIPHLVDKSEFPLPSLETGRMATPWAVHQALVTTDFAQHNKVLTWLLGGLNYHKEHHLFPTVCHVNYPAMAKVVEQTCRDFGLPYNEYPSFLAGVAAHYRWLRRMGREN